MLPQSPLVTRDLNHIWHPCSQMKDYENFPPLEIVGAMGSHLHLKDGRQLIDAISSWWCKTLGHGHRRLRNALTQQMEKFEHVILANTTNELIVKLSEALTAMVPALPNMPKLSHVFYGGDGSTAVEIAVKLALHSCKISQNKKAPKLMALENGYHGETALTLALGDLGIYSDPYRELFPPVIFLRGLPYVDSVNHPLWNDCSEVWPEIERQLEKNRDNLCAIIIEPILQGAGGMKIYSADFLRRLRSWTLANQVFLIADEILTAYGRTGPMLACEHASIVPDLICLSKGLTSGWLPMSAVLVSDSIYDLFYSDYGSGKDFLHSNTYCGNALGAAVALETLSIYRDEKILETVAQNQPLLRAGMERVAQKTGKLKNLRSIGAVVAADLQGAKTGLGERAGFRVYQAAVERGALLRNLGDTVYWFLPLNAGPEVILELENITSDAINAALG